MNIPALTRQQLCAALTIERSGQPAKPHICVGWRVVTGANWQEITPELHRPRRIEAARLLRA